MDQDLQTRWRALCPAATAVGDDLLRRYGAPDRHYHDQRHLREVLTALDALARYAADITAVRLAAWFHDAVYEGRPGADEEASARLAEQTLPGCGIEPDRVAEVARLVRLTATHDPADDDHNGAVLCDADLAILAAAPERYAEYAADVRKEYAHVPAETFRPERAAVLQRLLDQGPLYRTPLGRERWETAARRNVAEEVRRLRADQP